jgi:hypothetical protein
MDVEKTIHAILQAQLRSERRADRFDKQLHVTADLVKKGIKIVVDMRKETNFKLNALMDAQIRTDAKLDRLLDNLGGKSRNGHK